MAARRTSKLGSRPRRSPSSFLGQRLSDDLTSCCLPRASRGPSRSTVKKAFIAFGTTTQGDRTHAQALAEHEHLRFGNFFRELSRDFNVCPEGVQVG